MEQHEAVALMQNLLRAVKERQGSDLFVTTGFPPAVKVDGQVRPLVERSLTGEEVAMMVRALMNDRQNKEFESSKECNFAIYPQDIGRFRVNAFVQQGRAGAVLRVITSEIPTFEELELPEVLREICMSKRGLALVVGATGSGKSTTLAAMVGFRNQNSRGHIITIEDPVEYMHRHIGCIITQREVGVDTESWGAALKNTLRQAPDVILIGEIRDRQTMEYAVQFAETGHLCLATLHANSANQALERIVNFFPEERRDQLLMDLSLNLRAIVSQRLVRHVSGEGRIAAMEIMLNSPLVADLIFKGDIARIKEIMAKSRERGMVTFDQFLFELFEKEKITYEEALRNADSQNELRLKVKLESKHAGRVDSNDLNKITLVEDDHMESKR